ncbi:Ribonuclease H-like domain [Trinorchestia longiramus]|nr:Ribonuclease H-like domain [Trinorchestia longiramus]
MNRTILEAVRAMLSDSKLPKTFWAEAVSTAVYVKNRSPTSAHKNLTPYQALNGHKPNVQHFRTFGCMAYAHVPKDEREKLDSKSKSCSITSLFMLHFQVMRIN